jgi:hypothetical protein
MTVKTLAVLQGEILCKLKEIIKKSELLHEKEELGEEANYLLKMISENLDELIELFKHKKILLNKVKNLRQTETGLF